MYLIGYMCPKYILILDPNSLSNYRPISHLPLLSKILERIVSKQLIAHINKNNLIDTFQGAFRKGLSTE